MRGGVHRLSPSGLNSYFWTQVLINFTLARKPLDFGPIALTPCFCRGRHSHPQTTRRTPRPLRFCFVLFFYFLSDCTDLKPVYVYRNASRYSKRHPASPTDSHTTFFTCVLCVFWQFFFLTPHVTVLRHGLCCSPRGLDEWEKMFSISRRGEDLSYKRIFLWRRWTVEQSRTFDLAKL